jgi:nucleotidyltransferase/DNA polymerase involved in DNA repair
MERCGAAAAQRLGPDEGPAARAREVSDSEWRVAALPMPCRPAYGGYRLSGREAAAAAAKASRDDVARQRARTAAAARAGGPQLAAAAAAVRRAAEGAEAAAAEARGALEDRAWLRALDDAHAHPAPAGRE